MSEALVAVLKQQERSLSWLARKTGKSPTYVTRVIQGERKASDDFKAKASLALGVPTDLIFPEAA